MNFKCILQLFVIFTFTACSTNVVEIKNEKQGRLKASVQLEVCGEKKFLLDEESVPMPRYTQIVSLKGGKKYFTFLNKYNNSIYLFDYDKSIFEHRIAWDKEGANGISGMRAYHIKSLDSIYLYDKKRMGLYLSNNEGNILRRISLRGKKKDKKWFLKFPQFIPNAIAPFIETTDELLFTGFGSPEIQDSKLSKFKITVRLNLNMNDLNYSFSYPSSLYNDNYNWGDSYFTLVYSDLHPDGNKLLLSFPVSHNLYVADLHTGEYKTVYAGSNFAGSICSFDKSSKNTTLEYRRDQIQTQDWYTAIKYDKYRKVYYRFIMKSSAVEKSNTSWKEKPIAVIIFNEDFDYLGETVIGTMKDFNWQNSFVTEEGLNIEYIETKFEEVYLTLKIFTIKKLYNERS